MDAPMSPPPPYSFGKPIPVWPLAASSTTTSLTRSRNSSRVIVSASSRTEAYCTSPSRTVARIAAYGPSSSSVSAGTSTWRSPYGDASASGAVGCCVSLAMSAP